VLDFLEIIQQTRRDRLGVRMIEAAMHNAMTNCAQARSEKLWQMTEHLVESPGMILHIDLMFCSSTRSSD